MQFAVSLQLLSVVGFTEGTADVIFVVGTVIVLIPGLFDTVGEAVEPFEDFVDRLGDVVVAPGASLGAIQNLHVLAQYFFKYLSHDFVPHIGL